MITLDATDEILELLTTAAVTTDVFISFADHTDDTFVGGSQDTQIASATTTSVLAAPAASTQRQVKFMCVRNRSTTTTQTVTLKFDKSGTERYLTPDVTLQPGDALQYTATDGFVTLTNTGARKVASPDTNGIAARQAAFLKVGTAAESVGQWYCHSKDTGNPGAWAVGTSGLAGRATDGTAAGDAGCLPYQNASTGANYLVNYMVTSSVAHSHWLFDVLWVNNGIVVTTTTAQTINSVTFASRDLNGSTGGVGVWVGILVTTATTNAGAITNTTMSYTNQAGTGGRTATISSYPATAVIGTVVWFQLAAGDTGVRSIQSITLGTSYAGGAISLIAAVPVAMAPNLVANLGGIGGPPHGIRGSDTGIRLYDGACLLPFYVATATTATVTSGVAEIVNR